MKKLFMAGAIATTSLFSGGNAVIMEQMKAEAMSQIAQVRTPHDFKSFLGIGFNALSSKTDSILGDPSLIPGALDDNGFLGDAGIEMRVYDNFFIGAEYIYASTEFTNSNIFLGSLNYHADYLFAGVLAGGQWLEWADAPILNSDPLTEDRNANRFVYGFQVGASYPLEDGFSVYGKYQFLTGENLTTKINGNPMLFENQNNFIFGVFYEF